MSGSPENSAIKVTRSLEEKIAAATSLAEIETLMHQAALSQRLVQPDVFDETILHAVDPSGAPQTLTKRIVVNDVEHLINGADASELAHNEAALFRRLFSEKSDATDRTEPARDSQTGRFLHTEPELQETDEAARIAELQLKMLRGEITGDQFLAESGAFQRYEARRENQQNQQIIGAWKFSVEEFLHSPAGADWPGGEMLQRMSETLESMGVERSPSVDALSRAWEHIKQHDFENSVREQAESCNDPYTLKAVLQPNRSSFFDR